ncbi:hypothetical protein MED92_03553 [Oceanospirillum sp. MED92]|uniref:Uncharacterized protein n=1 Tax=Neptuniibacter caesariensis TaxID=207954 RepID=A0A7U8GS08_NEPCE|nr:hypothetical protein MED92_03553 [Oceanospirillum sp. MED92] [Neptuniibacter caesariensis]
MHDKHLIILIGLIYSFLISVIFEIGFVMFGISATGGALWTVHIARKRNQSIKALVTSELGAVISVLAAIILTGVMFSLRNIESFYSWLGMVPAMATFGFAYMVSVNRLNTFLWNKIKSAFR